MDTAPVRALPTAHTLDSGSPCATGLARRSLAGDEMKISRIMSNHVWVCRNDATLEGAAQLMWEHDIGALPVIDERNRVIGMITDRDACMAAYIRGLPLRAIPVTAAMATKLVTCREDDDDQEVARRMATARIHRIPVVDEQERLRGIVSLNDLALAMRRGREVTAAEVAETLAAVGEPRKPLTATA